MMLLGPLLVLTDILATVWFTIDVTFGVRGFRQQNLQLLQDLLYFNLIWVAEVENCDTETMAHIL